MVNDITVREIQNGYTVSFWSDVDYSEKKEEFYCINLNSVASRLKKIFNKENTYDEDC